MGGNNVLVVRSQRPPQLDADGGPALWCADFDVSAPRVLTPPEEWAETAAARILVRIHGVPLGFITIPAAGILEPELVLKSVNSELLSEVNQHLKNDGSRVLEEVPAGGVGAAGPGCPSHAQSEVRASVVVCTRDRPEMLRSCLGFLRALQSDNLDILVVDNAPTTDATRLVVAEFAADPRIRYVREPRPGLSRARNRGLAEVTGELIVFTDDDVAVDPDWIRAVRAPFADPAVACVTGLVCTASISGPAEHYFDSRITWGERCRPERYDLASDTGSPIYPYSPALFGTGANFAFRTDVLRAMGGFDEALGAGTPAAGGEDCDIFVRTVLDGHTIAYEPAALVWHHHRAELAGLDRQMWAYGSGLTAFLAKHLLDRRTRGEVLRRVPQGLRHVARIGGATRHKAAQELVPDAPAHGGLDSHGGLDRALTTRLLLRELQGCLAGPYLYVKAARSNGADAQRATTP